MSTLHRLLWLILLVTSAALAPAIAEEAKPAPQAAQTRPATEEQAFRLPPDKVSQHTISLAGVQLAYKATAGTIPLQGQKGELAARMFYVAYIAENAGPRPITFAFNGGPGASAAFLHMGLMGPRIVPFQEKGAQPVLPVQIADNPNSWLSFTDLVFIDPVGTGYSRAIGGGQDAQRAYWGTEKDADSIIEFIRLYLARNGRDLSPVFLAGESYGGFRAALLADRILASGYLLKGTVLISPALEFSVLRGGRYSLLPLTFALPSLTAANIEMQDGPNAPLDTVREAEVYARTTYLVHLAAGLKNDDAVNAALAKFTGLDPQIIARQHGRVPTSVFTREYQRRTDRALSVYDATVSVPMPRPSNDMHFDPILDGAVTVLTPATVQYIRQELGFVADLQYHLLNREASGHWDFGIKPGRQGYAGSLEELQKARIRNNALGVFIAHGYTDLVTPFSMSAYLIGQLQPIEGAAPVDLHVYRGGHMMYLRPASRAELTQDVERFFRAKTK
ncbi:MAG TPA: peptidase S10 [Hyphomicrobiales bacterium]|nr:peptidase S10 [Hyphomicrobiales bacterium]